MKLFLHHFYTLRIYFCLCWQNLQLNLRRLTAWWAFLLVTYRSNSAWRRSQINDSWTDKLLSRHLISCGLQFVQILNFLWLCHIRRRIGVSSFYLSLDRIIRIILSIDIWGTLRTWIMWFSCVTHLRLIHKLYSSLVLVIYVSDSFHLMCHNSILSLHRFDDVIRFIFNQSCFNLGSVFEKTENIR